MIGLERRIQQFSSVKLFIIIIILQEVIINLNKALTIQMNLFYGASMYVNNCHCCNDKASPKKKKSQKNPMQDKMDRTDQSFFSLNA